MVTLKQFGLLFWKPEASLNWLPCIGNMRIDLQKRIQNADVNIRAKNCLKFTLCSLNGSLNFNEVFLFHGGVTEISSTPPPPLCKCHLIYARGSRLFAVAGHKPEKDNDTGWLWGGEKKNTGNTKHMQVTL